MSAQPINSPKMGIKLLPRSVNAYSTLGGISANKYRFTRPSASRSFSVLLNTFDDMSGIALLIALKRVLSFSDSIHNISIGHLPDMCESTFRIGQCEMSEYFSKFFCIGNEFIFNINNLNVTALLLSNFLCGSKKRLKFAVLKVKRVSAAKLVVILNNSKS